MPVMRLYSVGYLLLVLSLRVLARRLESGVWPNLRDHGHER